MEAVFIKLFNMSVSAIWLVLAVIIIRAVIKKLPKAVRVIMWSLVGLRLLLPITFESNLSLIPSTDTVPTNIVYTDTPMIHSGISFFNSAVNPIISESLAPAPGDSVNKMQVIAFIAALVWVVGMVIMLAYLFVSYIRIRFKVREAVVYRDNIYLCDRVADPFILGIIRPRIYLPSDVKPDDIEYIIAHEKAHEKRHDNLWKPLAFLFLTVYWFNPVLWLAYALFCRDIELACDERVIKESGEEYKKPYLGALINCSVSHKTIAACPLAFGEVAVKSRVIAVLNYKKPAFWVTVVSVLVCTFLAIAFLTNPVTTLDAELARVIDEAILDNHGGEKSYGHIRCFDKEILGVKKDGSETTVYMWVLYEEYSYDTGLKLESAAHTPTAVTVNKTDAGYEIKEYFTPRDGAHYEKDIKAKFPFYLEGKAVDSQRYIDKQQAACKKMAEDKLKLLSSGQSPVNPIYKMYGYFDSVDPIKPSVILFEDGTFQFRYSGFSSYIPMGKYVSEDGTLTLNTDDGKYTYIFENNDGDIVFVESESSPIPKYRYSGKSNETKSPVPDGAVFKEMPVVMGGLYDEIS